MYAHTLMYTHAHIHVRVAPCFFRSRIISTRKYLYVCFVLCASVSLVYICVCARVYVCAHTNVYARAHQCVCVWPRSQSGVCVLAIVANRCARTHACMRTHTCLRTRTTVSVYVHLITLMYVRAYTHVSPCGCLFTCVTVPCFFAQVCISAVGIVSFARTCMYTQQCRMFPHFVSDHLRACTCMLPSANVWAFMSAAQRCAHVRTRVCTCMHAGHT